MKCERWNEPLFIRYRESNVSLEEMVELHNHFNECPACYERFIIPLREELDTPSQSAKRLPRYLPLAASLLVIILAGTGIIYNLLLRPWYEDYTNSRMPTTAAVSSRSDKTKLTRYDLFNKEIDNYLSAMASKNIDAISGSLASAQKIADEMLSQTGERFGQDIIEYYKRVPSDAINPLREARQLCAEAEAMKPNSDFALIEEKATKAKAIFERYGSQYEIANANLQIMRVHGAEQKDEHLRMFIEDEIERAQKSQYLYLYVQLLYLKGQIFSSFSDFSNAISTLEKSAQEASRLNVPNFIIKPLLTLTTVYYIINDNTIALKKGLEVYQLATELNNKSIQLQVCQILGLLECSFGRMESAKKYIEKAIALSVEQKDEPQWILSHAFLGVVLTEEGSYSEAEKLFSEAVTSLDRIQTLQRRSYVGAIIFGYYARSQMLAGKVEQAFEFYSRSLELSQKANLTEKLMLSQLHQGLGECLRLKGNLEQAESELAMAKKLENEAKERCETNNALLTFAVSRKTPEKCN